MKRLLGWVLLVLFILVGSYLLIKVSSIAILFRAVGITAIIAAIVLLLSYLLE